MSTKSTVTTRKIDMKTLVSVFDPPDNKQPVVYYFGGRIKKRDTGEGRGIYEGGDK